ncbi:plasmid partitioning protein ParB, partial [Pelagibacteraceae bacterium GOM-A3]
LIIEEKLSQGHAKILVGLDNAILLAKKIISKKLSVRQAESLVRVLKSSYNNPSKNKDPNIASLEEELTHKIGMRVFVKNKKNNSGTISVEYKGIEQLDRLVEIIKQNY